MTTAAIRVSKLGKQFRLGGAQSDFPTLRDSLSTAVRGVRRLATSGLRGGLRRKPAETFWALRDVSFDVAEGEVIGIVGGNGAGKSTLLKVLSQITAPTEGRVEITGRVGSLLEVGTGFHPELSGRENIYLNGAILGMTRHEVVQKFDDIVAFAEVEKFIDTAVKHYSSGMYLRLAFAVAAHLEPEILIVDEVLAVGDVAFQKKCMGKMGDVAKQGRTVLFVSHNLLAVEALCSRAVRLRSGRLVDQGTAGDVVSRYLRENATQATERQWSADEAPGNEHVRLYRAAVRPRDDGSSGLIDVKTPFVVEFDYFNVQPNTRLHLSFNLFNEQGVMVFSAGPLVGELQPLERGLFRDTCAIPADLMNEGSYSIELFVGRNMQETVYIHRDVLAFEVKDSAVGRGAWFEKCAGVVRPNLPWTTHPLGDDHAG